VSEASTEVFTKRELRRRLREVYEASVHLAGRIPVDNPHNATLRVHDIARFINAECDWLLYKRVEAPPPRCTFGCPSVNECRKKPACRDIEPFMQRQLTAFFKGWDSGNLVKARVGNEWRVVSRETIPRHAALASLVAAAGTQGKTINGRVELTEQGPRIKL
jgi:hypothetical protein